MPDSIKLENISVKFKDKQIISNIFYEFKSKKFYTIFGKSGTGKSTLLKILPNLISFSGEVFLNNENIQKISPQQLRRQIHYLHQEPVLFQGTVEENLKIPFTLKNNLKLKYQKDEALKILNLTGLSADILNAKAEKLSGGEKQRVCLTRAILMQPKFLLLDEPSSALDMSSEAQLIKIIKTIANEIGVICVSHSAKIILSTETKLLMEHGKLVQKDEKLDYDKIYKMVEDEQSYS